MPSEQSIDVVKEIRLRNWARRNYVAPDQRKAGWHPIVLDEMARRDRESFLETDWLIADWAATPVPATLVPAETAVPGTAVPVSTERLDGPEALGKPHMAEAASSAASTPRTAETEDSWTLTTMVSAFVPLAPGPFRVVHAAHEGVPAPNMLGQAARERQQQQVTREPALPESW